MTTLGQKLAATLKEAEKHNLRNSEMRNEAQLKKKSRGAG